MPELVEVKTDAELLDFYLSGRTLTDIAFVTDLFKNKCKGLEELQKCLPLKVEKVLSRAKKLFFHLVDSNGEQQDWWIFLTYGMTGRISSEKLKHSHIEFKMSANKIGFNTFYYSNMRRIGEFEASCDLQRYLHHVTDMAKPIALGYDDEKDFQTISKEEFTQNLKSCKNSYLVSKLMDQRSIVSGIGNYKLSEIIYEAKLHPDIRCNEIEGEKINILWDAIHKVILESYKNGGVSMSDYVHADGTLGIHEAHLKVYGKTGEDSEGRKILSKKGKHGRTIWYVNFN